MRQVMIDGPGSVVVVDAPDPVLLDPTSAIVEVSRTAICGSDLHFYDGDIPVGDGIAVGHEFIGTVVEVGAQVSRFAVGDTVLTSSVAGCGRCDGCATLDPVTCVDGPLVFGSGMLGGGQATHVVVPAADFQMLAIPAGIGEDAALLLTDNLSTGWAGARRADVRPGDSVAVIGLGPVGLCAVRSAIALGAGTVLAVDPVVERRQLAAASGATVLEGPTTEAILKATAGRGAHSVIDAVALDATLHDAFASVRAGGTISVIGVHDLAPYPMPMLMSLFRSITVRTTTAPVQRTWSELVPLLLDGTLRTEGIFTHALPLSEAAEAYRLAASRADGCMKVALVP